MEILFKREQNLMIKQRPIKIYLNDEFIDYINPKDRSKKIRIEKLGKLYLKVNNNSSNIINIINIDNIDNTDLLKFSFTSQIQNGLFIFIAFTFFAFFISYFFDFVSNYVRIAFLLPLGMIVYWQTLGKKNYLRLTKEN